MRGRSQSSPMSLTVCGVSCVWLQVLAKGTLLMLNKVAMVPTESSWRERHITLWADGRLNESVHVVPKVRHAPFVDFALTQWYSAL